MPVTAINVLVIAITFGIGGRLWAVSSPEASEQGRDPAELFLSASPPKVLLVRLATWIRRND